MKIITRDGQQVPLNLNEITDRIRKACAYCGVSVDSDLVAIKVVNNIRELITTSELDEITAKICINMSMDNPEYATLGSRIVINNHQKNVRVSFSEAMEMLYSNNGDKPLVSDELIQTVRSNRDTLNITVEVSKPNDFLLDFFGFKTLERSYLLRDSKGKIWETPQYLWMRVALGMWGSDLGKVNTTFHMLSQKNATHATPTLFNCGTPRPALSSCFLLGTEDSIEGIYENITDCAKISKWAGGIGVHVSNIRPKGSYIQGTGGKTDGIIPMMKVYNSTARYVNQCFTPDTIVYTQRGAICIEDIRETLDSVITSDGTYKRVNRVFVSPRDEEIVRITPTMGSGNALKCTKVHQIMVVPRGTPVGEFSKYRKWVSADEVSKGDYMCFPVPKIDGDNIPLDKVVRMNENFTHYGTYTDMFGDSSLESVNEAIDFICDKNLRDLECEQNNEYVAGFPLKLYALNKKAHDNFRFALLRIGQLSKGRNVSEEAWEIDIPKTREMKDRFGSRVADNPGFVSEDNWLYTPVESVETVHYSGRVYDLNVEDNHNYLTENGLVHNSGKRLGSIAIYLEPWHSDIFDFLGAMRNHGHEESLARDLYYALWIPDLFMKKVKSNGDWYLMNNNDRLTDLFGDEFEEYYNLMVSQGKYTKKIKAIDLWNEILKSQQESGMPYMGYKDHVNRKNNQQNIGTIKSSNLCIEINEYSDNKEVAVCNLASIRLQSHLVSPRIDGGIVIYISNTKCSWCDILRVFLDSNGYDYETIVVSDKETFFRNFMVSTLPQVFINSEHVGGFMDTSRRLRKQIDYPKLQRTVHTLVDNINRVIDINYYPIEKARNSNLRHRPMGIGVQGLADTFAEMWVPYESEDALSINREIFEAIYFYAIEKSLLLAIEQGPYETFEGSPLSKGIMQYDMWGVTPSDRFDWNYLRDRVIQHGVRNSLLVALMPTASTAQIMGSTESFEPFNSCMYLRRTLSGEFLVINNYLIDTLIRLGLWNQEMKQRIMFHRGSIQKIDSIPSFIREMYKTVWEVKKKHYLDMSAQRGAYVCQSQSLNIYLENSNSQVLSNIHMYGWKIGLKTGSYYIRTRPAANAQSFTIDPELENKFKREMEVGTEECLSCGA